MLYRLVAMCIIAHVHDLHFPYFMDHYTIIRIIEQWRHSKNRIELWNESFFTSHQVDKSGDILKNAPCIVPAVTLGEGISPLVRAEWRLEGAIGIPSAHKLSSGIKDISIIHGPLTKEICLWLRTPQNFWQFADTEICIGILESPCDILINTDIVRYITKCIIVFYTKPSNWAQGPCAVAVFQDRLVKSFYIIPPDPFQVGIGNYGSWIRSYHAIPMPRTCPLREPSALFVSIHKPFHDLAVHVRVHKGCKREKSPEGIPESIVGEHVSRQYLATIGAIVNHFFLIIYFIEAARKEKHSVKTWIECPLLVKSAPFNLYPAQLTVPGSLCFRSDLIKALPPGFSL